MSTPSQRIPRVLADVGGTNARFAWQDGADAPIADVLALPTADHATIADALGEYLKRSGHATPLDCAIAIANPITGDQVRMTNHHWSFSISALQAQFGFARLKVLNDFTALALALPALQPDELQQVGGGSAVAGAPIALIGPGTGLGVSGLLPDPHGGWVPLQGEGGHVTLAATTPREHAVLQRIAERYGHASAERAVSGQGLVDVHHALQLLDGAGDTPLEASAITEAALAGRDARCAEAVSLFCAFLGTAAGNLALTLGARGGVYIGGGIVPRFGMAFGTSPFRARFDAKGRFRNFLEPIPVYVIRATRSPAFLGAARALDAD
jgi:glucokinase